MDWRMVRTENLSHCREVAISGDLTTVVTSAQSIEY